MSLNNSLSHKIRIQNEYNNEYNTCKSYESEYQQISCYKIEMKYYMNDSQDISTENNQFKWLDLDYKDLKDIFKENQNQINEWMNDASLKIYSNENLFSDQIISMVKNGVVNEEEAIDFINNRACSL